MGESAGRLHDHRRRHAGVQHTPITIRPSLRECEREVGALVVEDARADETRAVVGRATDREGVLRIQHQQAVFTGGYWLGGRRPAREERDCVDEVSIHRPFDGVSLVDGDGGGKERLRLERVISALAASQDLPGGRGLCGPRQRRATERQSEEQPPKKPNNEAAHRQPPLVY